MAQISYDQQYYYKLVTDAKTKETTKTILGNVPILDTVQIDLSTDTVYYLLRTNYRDHAIIRSVPKQLFCDAYDLVRELMGLGFDIASNTSSSFLQVVLEQEKTAKVDYVHSKLGWFCLKAEDRPVFFFEHSYGHDLKSQYVKTCYLGRDLEAEESSDVWNTRMKFLEKYILTCPELTILYLLAMSAPIVGYLSETGHPLPAFAVQLRGDNSDAAEYLIASMLGEPTAVLAAPLEIENITSGIPLILHSRQPLLPSSTIVFTPEEYAAAWNISLPLPTITQKEKVVLLRESENAFGLDILKIVQTILDEEESNVYDRYTECLDTFSQYGEMDLHHRKISAVILTTLSYAEAITQLEFDREKIIQYLVSLFTQSKSSDSTKQKEYWRVISWITQNKKHFTWGRGSGNTKYFDLSHTGNEQIYGKIQMNEAGQPEKYYIRCDCLEKELQKLGCSTQTLSEWKQEGLLFCDRGSLWCRRVIDPETNGERAAVYVLAALTGAENKDLLENLQLPENNNEDGREDENFKFDDSEEFEFNDYDQEIKGKDSGKESDNFTFEDEDIEFDFNLEDDDRTMESKNKGLKGQSYSSSSSNGLKKVSEEDIKDLILDDDDEYEEDSDADEKDEENEYGYEEDYEFEDD